MRGVHLAALGSAGFALVSLTATQAPAQYAPGGIQPDTRFSKDGGEPVRTYVSQATDLHQALPPSTTTPVRTIKKVDCTVFKGCLIDVEGVVWAGCNFDAPTGRTFDYLAPYAQLDGGAQQASVPVVASEGSRPTMLNRLVVRYAFTAQPGLHDVTFGVVRHETGSAASPCNVLGEASLRVSVANLF